MPENFIEIHRGFRADLALAETFEEIKFIESKAAAAAEFAKKNRIGLEEQNQWGLFRIEIETKKGKWLDEKFPSKVNASYTLEDAGINFKESANARIVYKEPEIKDRVIKEIIETGHVVTPHAVSSGIRKEKKQTDLIQKKAEYINIYKTEIDHKPQIKNCPAKEFLNTYEDNSIDLLITDPPYSTDIDNIDEFVDLWLPLALDKIKINGRAYICTGAYPKEIFAYLRILLNQKKFIVDNPLIWTYRNTLGITPKMKYNLNYQIIWHLYNENSRVLDTSITNEMFSVMDINAPDGRQGNRIHTWQKPDELAHRLIRHSTKENDLIVDCFCGTGTFLLAGAKQKRIAKGCDISFDNLKIAQERGCKLV